MSQNRNDTTSGQRGPKLTVREIPKEQAIGFIRRYHYSKIMPRLNKHYLGFYTGNRLAGVVALVRQSRPLNCCACPPYCTWLGWSNVSPAGPPCGCGGAFPKPISAGASCGPWRRKIL